MLKTVVIDTSTYKVVPIEPDVEFFRLANKLDNESWAGNCSAADNETIYHCVIDSAPEVKSGWLPIETAPKDGTTIVVGFNRQSGFPVKVVFYNRVHNFWSHYGSAELGLEANATHWMPLPDVPVI